MFQQAENHTHNIHSSNNKGLANIFQLNNVTKTYECRGESINALYDSTLAIDHNDIIALVGPSGSGKTTMLSLLGGMIAPTSGEVLFAGRSLYDMSLIRMHRKPRPGFTGTGHEPAHRLP
jgi:ABC-type lipoprotein export system ATPase subunit